MAKNKTLLDILTKGSPWTSNENDIWLVSSVKFYRNLEKYKFPLLLDQNQREQVLQLVDREVAKCKDCKALTYFPAEDLSARDKEYIVEHFVVTTEGIHQARKGRGFVVNETGTFLLGINIRNHLQMQLLDFTEDLEKTLNRLIHFESNLGTQLKYAYNPRFGFLTADPEKCGTALVVQAFLHLPGLIHDDNFEETIKSCAADGVTLTGIQGRTDHFAGDVVILQNSRTLGLSEEQVVSSVRTRATKLLVDEQSKRQEFKKAGRGKFKDMVSRAYGLLCHSYRMETLEALDAVSMIKLGSALGWISGISPRDVNTLFFGIRRGHLSATINEEPDPKELAVKRSEYLKDGIAKAKLEI